MAKFITRNNTGRIKDTDYYKWLESTSPEDIHNARTKIQYLESLGFIKGESFISEEDLTNLKQIEQHYFRIEIAPKL